MHNLSILGRPVALVILFGALLLTGRFALATHPYEHDAGIPAADCELCEFGHVSGSAAVSDKQGSADGPVDEDLIEFSRFPPRTAPWRIHFPRAPPVLV